MKGKAIPRKFFTHIYAYTLAHTDVAMYLYSGSPLKPVGFIAVHVLQKNPKQLRGHFHVHTETLKDEAEHILLGVCVCVCERVRVCVGE